MSDEVKPRNAAVTGAEKNPTKPVDDTKKKDETADADEDAKKADETAKPEEPKAPWQENQQKDTQPKNSDDREKEKKADAPKKVKIKMKTDYMEVAKAGDLYETDREKAEELVRLGRAEYPKKK